MMSDAELMQKVREGDEDAFRTIVDRYKDQLLNYLKHLPGNRELAEDLAQETFVRLYRTRERYDERGRLAPLLFRIATNLARSEGRKAAIRRFITFDFLEMPVDASQQRGMLTDEIRSKVTTALAELPLHYRSPLVMREIEEWSYEEIAEALGLPPGTVKSRIARGRELLRRALSPYWTGEDDERYPASGITARTPTGAGLTRLH